MRNKANCAGDARAVEHSGDSVERETTPVVGDGRTDDGAGSDVGEGPRSLVSRAGSQDLPAEHAGEEWHGSKA